jgi:hypothetical protein
VDIHDELSTLRKGVLVERERKTRHHLSKRFKAETVALIRRSGKSMPQVWPGSASAAPLISKPTTSPLL